MKTIVITGSIGMGKSTVAKMFAEFGQLPLWDADAAVHRLYKADGPAVAPLKDAFDPDGKMGLVTDNGIDRQILGAHLQENPSDFAKLNAIVHPLVFKDREDFMAQAKADQANAVLFDIPLLYENGYQSGFDYVVCVIADEDIRRVRVLQRPNMTAEKLDMIIAKQLPDQEKAARADYVVRTDCEMHETEARVKEILKIVLP